MLDIYTTREFDAWLSRLRDGAAKGRIAQRLERASLTGNLGDAKPVGGQVFELRLSFGPGYRVYFARRGAKVILLLIGGDKSSQRRDIARAQELNRIYE